MVVDSDIAALLKQHKLKITPTRVDILRVFHVNKHAIDHAEISEQIGSEYDRVTVYRTLNSFEEKGLIHSIVINEGAKKYALCSHTCHGHHAHDHVHFTCKQCDKTVCLEDFTFDIKDKYSNYLFEELNITAKGICPECKN